MYEEVRKLVRGTRERLGVNPQELARRLGYKNVDKGANRILRFEYDGTIEEELFRRLVVELEIDQGALDTAIEADHRAWEAWLDEPVPMEFILRLMATVYMHMNIPEEIDGDPEAVLEWARGVVKEEQRHGCLVLSRRESVWLYRDGGEKRRRARPGIPNKPTAFIGKKPVLWKEGK